MIITFDETNLPYVIVIKNEVIGAFQNLVDRDDCGLFLQDRYPDVEFKKVNLLEE